MAKNARGSKPKKTQRRGSAPSGRPAAASGSLALSDQDVEATGGSSRHSRMVPRGTATREEAAARLEAEPRVLAAPRAPTLLSPAADPFPSAASLDALTTSRSDELESEPFFSRPDVSVLALDEDDSWDVVDASTRRHEPAVVERRARLSRIVTRVVVAAVALGAIGGARAWLASRGPAIAPLAPTAVAITAPSVTAIAPAAAPLAIPPVEAVAPSSAPTAPVVADGPASPAPSQPEQAPVAAQTTASVEAPPASARALVTRAKQALEAGAAAKARTLAELATQADGGDAEAWLVLGAAHQEMGDGRAARAVFRKCTELSTHGPKGECAALLR